MFNQGKTLLIVQHTLSKERALDVASRLANLVIVTDQPATDRRDAQTIALPSLSVDQIVKALEERQIAVDACLTFVDPATTLTAGVAKQLGVPGLSESAAHVMKDKLLMRQTLQRAGSGFPHFCASDASIPSLVSAAAKIGFPCVIKPALGAYSLGVTLCKEPADVVRRLPAAITNVQESNLAALIPRDVMKSWLLESYVDGLDISVEVAGHPTDPAVLAIHEKVVSEVDGHFREDRFVTAPWTLSKDDVDRVRSTAVAVCKALQFSRGVGNLEMRIAADSIIPIELQCCPTGGLVSAMVERTTGCNLHALHTKAFLSRGPLEISAHPATRACAMDILHAERPGRFCIAGIDEAATSEGVVAMEVFADSGNVMQPHAEYLGFICCEGEDAAEAVRRLDSARAKLAIGWYGDGH